MRKTNKVLAICFLPPMLLMSGCAATAGGLTNQQVGAVLGGVLGGIGGNQVGEGKGRTAAVIAGTLLGAAIGQSVGQSMDEVDRMKVNRSLETLPTGRATSWRNPDSGTRYAVTPTRTYHSESGTPCREFIMDAAVGGKTQQVYGTACRQEDGSWKVAGNL